jgi:hypothetical protein
MRLPVTEYHSLWAKSDIQPDCPIKVLGGGISNILLLQKKSGEVIAGYAFKGCIYWSFFTTKGDYIPDVIYYYDTQISKI